MKTKMLLEKQPQSIRLVHIINTAPEPIPDFQWLRAMCGKTATRDFIAVAGAKSATCKSCITTLLSRIGVLEGANPPTEFDRTSLKQRIERMRKLVP